jgi:hydrogenase maturation protease
MSTIASAPVVVFACGESLRGDDGAAHAAVDAVPQRAIRDVSVRHVAALGPEDLASLSHDATSIIVDAVVGVPPGEIVKLDLVDLPLAPAVHPTSSHQLPLDMIVGLAKLMGWRPRGVFLGVGGSDFAHGGALSPAVRRIVPALGDAIATEIERIRLEQRPPEATCFAGQRGAGIEP